MHKKIALLIKRMVDDSPYTHFDCDVIPNIDADGNIKSDGFWKVMILFESRNDAHSESLVRSLHYIGMVYGEGLGIEDKGSEVTVS